MKVVIAIDSFKGSLSSTEAGNAVKEAVLDTDSTAEAVVRPLADGGEGTVCALAEGGESECVTVSVCGPLSRPVDAAYCILKKTNTAVIEIAAAAGITLIEEKERDPLRATTYGVGELIADAIKRGCRKFLIGLGGSATNDGGAGMLSALGYELLNSNGEPIALGAQGLSELYEIKTENVLPTLRDCEFNIACDVTNTLCGENGCSAVFGAQKGATPETIRDMDAWLANYANIAVQVSAAADRERAGTGAAGGLGFALLTFLGAKLKSGIELVLEETELEKYIKDADIVVTGEGRLDAQTVMGKAPIGVARLAKKHKKTVIAFCGAASNGAEAVNGHGIDAFFPILRSVCTLDEALDKENAYKNLKSTATQVFRLLTILSVRDKYW